jgi:MFS family permease
LVVDDAALVGKRDSFASDDDSESGRKNQAVAAAEKEKVPFGRVQTIMLCKVMGVSALFLMVYLIKYRGSWYIMVPIYLFRTGIMNSTYPLEESISMDFVPKDQRARWKSLESIAQFGWCGSAALGGWLADKHGYSFTFLISK